jgi:hypothetical protein
MKLWPSPAKPEESKAHPAGAAFAMIGGGNSWQRPSNAKAYIDEGYQLNVIVYRAVREIANAYEVPVIVVSSLAREGYKNDAKPNLYNSKESGDIEYATTIGLAMWREANEAQITMEIQKNRDGKAWEQFKLPPMVAGAAWYDLRQQ